MDEKNLDNENIDVTYLYESINKMKNDLKNINKNTYGTKLFFISFLFMGFLPFIAPYYYIIVFTFFITKFTFFDIWYPNYIII